MTDTAAALTLSDEVVLLTLDCRRRRVARALKLGGLPDPRTVTRDLARRELIELSRLRQRPRAAAAAPLALSRRRLSGAVRSVATPSGADAELLAIWGGGHGGGTLG